MLRKITAAHTAEMAELTKKLVAVSSVNGTPGERRVGESIEAYLRAIPYFQAHPEQVIVRELKDDPLGRRNVLALLKGRPGNGRTVVLHGHTDTVGVRDFGDLMPLAFDCEALAGKLAEIPLPEAVQADLDSGDYLFGRGSCDMKSGVAVFLVLMKALAEHPEELDGNLLAAFNPVEENQHTGVIESLPILMELKKTHGLTYTLAINNDYTCPMYPGDPHRYLYTGAVGKLLPCFYVIGRETHVGQCFEGLDASLIATALVRRIHCNPDFSDRAGDACSLPPSVLKLRDLKDFYNVQTARTAFLYFNYFVYTRDMNGIIAQLKAAATGAMEDAVRLMNERFAKYCLLSGAQYGKIRYEPRVLTYRELFLLAVQGNETELAAETARKAETLTREGMDKREIGREIVMGLAERAGIRTPTVVLFFAPPYCPHNTLADGEKTLALLRDVAARHGAENGEEYRVEPFYPSLSDSSYLTMDDPEESVRALTDNFAAYEQLYPLPFEEIRALNIPAVNFGCYGKDAHKWTERVYTPYSFRVLPELVLRTVDALFD